MALFNPKGASKQAKGVPYKGKPNPQEAKAMALVEANAKKEMALKEAKKIEAKTFKKAEVVEEKVSEETQEKEY